MSYVNLQGLQFVDLPSEDRINIVEVIDGNFTNNNTSNDGDENSDQELFNTSD